MKGSVMYMNWKSFYAQITKQVKNLLNFNQCVKVVVLNVFYALI